MSALALVLAFLPGASAQGSAPDWSDDSIDITPAGSRAFLGQFGDETVSLTLSDLPVHTELTLTFDLYVIQSWDGNFRKFGPDVFDLSVAEGPTLLRTTFASPDTDLRQSYPDPYPGGHHPAGTGASEVNTLGYRFFGDSVYRLTFTFPHSEGTVDFDFSANLSEELPDESWGLDEVTVAADEVVVYSLNEPEVVLDAKAGEAWAFANDEYIAYTRYGRQSSALARPIAGGEVTHLNADGTEGLTGGFDPGTNDVIYQQFTDVDSDLLLYDLDTGVRSSVEGVNSEAWEWFPRISSTYIAFQRSYEAEGDRFVDLLVYERATGQTRAIGTWKERPRLVVWLGSVGDRYLTYMLVNSSGQNVFLVDLDTDTVQRIPNPHERQQMVAVVDEANSTVYFGREITQCGDHSGIWRLPTDLTGEPTRFLLLPKGLGIGWTLSLAPNAGSVDLYVEFYDCATEKGDVFVVPAVNGVPTT